MLENMEKSQENDGDDDQIDTGNKDDDPDKEIKDDVSSDTTVEEIEFELPLEYNYKKQVKGKHF